MKYRDYFSLKTLSRFGVEPDRKLPESPDAVQMKQEILSAFGERDRGDAEFLSHKTDCALIDLRVTDVPVREQIEVTDVCDDFTPADDFFKAPDAPEIGRTL